jgi:hypothetical protein
MKCYLLAVGLITISAISAQEPPKDLDLKVQVPTQSLQDQPKTYSITPRIQLIDLAKLSHTLPNGNKVYSLPQDNMPCVVPLGSGNMPVVSPGINGPMPNPAVPLLKKPITMTPEELQRLWNLKLEQKKKKPIHR